MHVEINSSRFIQLFIMISIHIKITLIIVIILCLLYIGILIYRQRDFNPVLFKEKSKWLDRNVTFTSNIQWQSSKSESWKPRFIQGQIPSFYLYGASIRNTSQPSIPDEIAIYGQWSTLQSFLYFTNEDTHCCLNYQQVVLTSHIIRRRRRTIKPLVLDLLRKDFKLMAFYFVCPLPGHIQKLPVEASIAFGEYGCTDGHLPYIQTFTPIKSEQFTIGVTNKVAHGSLNSNFFIEWFEAILHIGVDKVLTYADVTLNTDARKVLHHYESIGVCEVIPLELPDLDQYNRSFTDRGEQAWNDYQIIQWDSLERLRGYSYYGQLDTDEVLIPSGNRSFKQLLMDLDDKYNTIKRRNAGYYFTTAMLDLDFMDNNSNSDMEMSRYIYGFKEPVMERFYKKSFVLPESVDFYMGSEIAYMVPKHTSLQILDVPPHEGYVWHYRHCNGTTLREGKTETITEMRDWVKSKIESKVRRVRQLIFET